MSAAARKPFPPRERHIASEHGPHPVDVHVGGRVRQRRLQLGMSQERLGNALGLTFQQVQKYERGTNRIGSSRLYEISKLLDVAIGFFFEGAPGAEVIPGMAAGEQAAYEAEPRLTRDTQDLLRAYSRIQDPKLKRRIVELAKTLADIDAD